MNLRRKDEFAKIFDINEDIVLLAHEKVREKLQEHFSGMEMEILAEASLFAVLNSQDVNIRGHSIYHATVVGDLGNNIFDQLFNYFSNVPDIASQYDTQIAEEIKEIIEGNSERLYNECGM